MDNFFIIFSIVFLSLSCLFGCYLISLANKFLEDYEKSHNIVYKEKK